MTLLIGLFMPLLNKSLSGGIKLLGLRQIGIKKFFVTVEFKILFN